MYICLSQARDELGISVQSAPMDGYLSSYMGLNNYNREFVKNVFKTQQTRLENIIFSIHDGAGHPWDDGDEIYQSRISNNIRKIKEKACIVMQIEEIFKDKQLV